MERSSKQAASSTLDEQTVEGEGGSQQHSVYQAQIERLTAADVVLVPYGILSQEVRPGCTQHTETTLASQHAEKPSDRRQVICMSIC